MVADSIDHAKIYTFLVVKHCCIKLTTEAYIQFEFGAENYELKILNSLENDNDDMCYLCFFFFNCASFTVSLGLIVSLKFRRMVFIFPQSMGQNHWWISCHPHLRRCGHFAHTSEASAGHAHHT